MKPVDLSSHPEGGRFQEVFRSSVEVVTSAGHHRSALTHIYFELNEGETSSFHRVSSDEVWNLYAGTGLRLFLWNPLARLIERIELSPATSHFCHVVPAGTWQAAEPIQGNVLCGCSVGPGFDFSDFSLMDPGAEEATQLLNHDPSLRRLLPV